MARVLRARGSPKGGPPQSPRCHAAVRCGGGLQLAQNPSAARIAPNPGFSFAVYIRRTLPGMRVKPPRLSTLPTACVSRCPKRRLKVRFSPPFRAHARPSSL